MKPLLVIAGPTGSGKSRLGLEIAVRFHGEIVNCDSLQLYRGFDAGTAKTPAAERRGLPHHLIDVLEASSVYSAGDYARAARRVIAEISQRERLPVVVGGTGFYLRALLDGLPELPARDPELRARLERRPAKLYRLLQRLDPPAAARIHPDDHQKLVRALEIRVLTRKPAPPVAAASPLEGYRTLKLGLNPDRAQLSRVLDERTREMFRSGLIEEVQKLLASGLTGEEKPFESLGYKQALEVVRGAMTREQAIEQTQIETRQYAKRQMTWFRRDKEIVWLAGFGGEAIEEASRRIVEAFGGWYGSERRRHEPRQ